MNFRNLQNINNKIWPVVSEKKIVEIVDARRRTTHGARRTTDIQWITKAHPEHSSGELKINVSIIMPVTFIWHRRRHYYQF